MSNRQIRSDHDFIMVKKMDRRIFCLIIFIILVIITLIKHRATSIRENEWELFKTKFNKKYSDKDVENRKRLVWEQNFQRIQEHNMEKKSFRMGVNQFSDLTFEEFENRDSVCKKALICKNFTLLERTKRGFTFRAPLNSNLPYQVNWTAKGFVTPVKNQGDCGSCWAFSATGSLEGQHFRATGKLLNFSEQQLVDCSINYGNDVCNGGTMNKAFEYIKDYGIESEQSYPYEAENNTCRYDKTKVVGHCRGFFDIKEGDEQDLQKAVASVGPISIAINSNHESFKDYKDGIYDEPKCSPLNLTHAVLVVGYGEENGKKYWLVKNSYGHRWGLNGYIKMSRGKNNQCGIASAASYPIV